MRDGKPDCSIGDDEEMCGENKIKLLKVFCMLYLNRLAHFHIGDNKEMYG